jgi:signal peptidase I
MNMEGNMQPPQEEGQSSNSIGSHIIDFVQSLVLFGAIFAIIYLFIAQPHKVSGNSMVPTFESGDYILTDKLSYRVGIPTKGDVIVLKNPKNESQDFIKRIIGIPGDKVKIENGQVFVNDSALPEDYLPEGTFTLAGATLREGEETIVPEDKYLVFGDNRNQSSDSRAWGFITRDEIVGKVFFRYWPPTTFGTT